MNEKFIVFVLTRQGIEPEFSGLVAEALSTRVLIGTRTINPILDKAETLLRTSSQTHGPRQHVIELGLEIFAR